MINYDMDTIVMVVVIGIVVAVLMEFGIKVFFKKVTTQQINLLSLLFGWLLAMLALMIFSGDFTFYSIVGIVGGVLSPGIYDVIVKGLKLRGGSNQ